MTIEGVTHALARPFLVLATQNPIEYEGTYPLPEAQLDRFLLGSASATASRDDEWEMLAATRAARTRSSSSRCSTRRVLLELQAAVEQVHVGEAVGTYIVALVAATRESFPRPPSARARAAAWPSSRPRGARRLSPGRDFVTPDDVKAVAVPALAHRRVMLKPELWVRACRRATWCASCSTASPRRRPKSPHPAE